MRDSTKPSEQKRQLSVFVFLAVLGLALGAFYLVQSGRLARGNPVCSVCKRPLHKAQTYTVISQDGGERLSCCPRCGLRFAIENQARPVHATDFSNGKLIDAQTAYYLEGSNIMECCASPTMRSDSGLICEMHFDRCMPSLATFGSLEDARTYQRKHGGRIVDFAAARNSVAKQTGR